MRLVRFGPPGQERPGVWLDNTPGPGHASILDVRASAFDIEDYNSRFFQTWGLERLRALAAEKGAKLLPAGDVRLGPPVARPGQIICLGKNYAAHAAEFDSQVPASPVFFAKSPGSLIGPFDPIRIPAASHVVDGEVELALVIGQTMKNVSEVQALSHIAGYTILNDVTDREVQRENSQWFLGKSMDTFCPMGPFLVTADEVKDPHRLRLFQRLNRQIIQDGSTSRMIFHIPFLLRCLSARMTLEPGDVVSTGTPEGIGSARTPPLLLRKGDMMESGIEGLGSMINPVTAG